MYDTGRQAAGMKGSKAIMEEKKNLLTYACLLYTSSHNGSYKTADAEGDAGACVALQFYNVQTLSLIHI